MLGVVGLNVLPFSNFAQQLLAQQHAKTRNDTQQDVQTDATCNIQQRWEFVAHNVVTKLQLFHRTCAMVSLWILATEVNNVSDSWKIRKKED